MNHSYKHFYRRFLEGHQNKLHFAAHSHHFWPDVSRDAHIKYWDDCARWSDEKWEHIFSQTIPNAQKHLAQILGLNHSEQIVFAPNTHELTSRLLSTFLGKKDFKLLTSSSEFHSWRRQVSRLSELDSFKVTQVDVSDFLDDRKKVIDRLKAQLQNKFDMLFISQVFFDSALALTDNELIELQEACPKETIMVVDGYHGFGAIPTNLKILEGKIFYLGGGYKYAQAGEGAGFMVVPKGQWRPANTGWFAEMTNLSKTSSHLVGYAEDASAFWGATQDPSGLYRFNAVWDLFKKENLNVDKIHQYVKSLQNQFLSLIDNSWSKNHQLKELFIRDLLWHGHFLTFEATSEAAAVTLEDSLRKNKVLIDRRGARLRFGFGLYQDQEDIQSLVKVLKNLPS